jgi:hypothetical protein
MEQDKFLPTKGIPKAELVIDKKTGIPLAVRPDRQPTLGFCENPVLSGGHRISLTDEKEFVIYEAKVNKPEKPLGY